jgi:hypothetical protein
MAQNSGYDRFLLAENNCGTIHPVSDKAPPLQAEEEGAPTYKELILIVIHNVDFTLPI